MQTVGEKLRKARLQKNVSLDEVNRQTRINQRVLEALEEDRAHNFLGFIYIKSFLKIYAQYLGLDGEKLLKEYVDSQRIEAHSPEPSLEDEGKTLRRFNPYLNVRIALIVVLSCAFIFYLRFVFRSISAPEEKMKGQKVRVTVAPGPPVEPVKQQDLVLEVRTKAACWLHVKADNQGVFQQTLSKGRREHWRARERIEVRIGKPEALEVFLNGKPVDLKRAQVKKSLIVTHEGIKGR